MKGKPIFNSSTAALANLTMLLSLCYLITACSSNPPAPVINRQPTKATTQAKPQKATAPKRQPYQAGDWRPDTYLVKAGDTLFSIGLAFGYDYKEIANVNRIKPPYVIRVGQALQLASLKKAEQQSSIDENVTTFALSDNAETTVIHKPVPASIVEITEPKAIREPYSDSAFNTSVPITNPATNITMQSTADKATDTASNTTTNTKPIDANNSPWAWPTQGKVLSAFNQAGNKGIDIAGTRGQAINAAGTGKVIYSGSDLRGYGKLVIIKHNATFLSVYAHNSAIMVKEGQQVVQGQKIAEMGDTDSPVVKLHFEIRKQGQSVDPLLFLVEN